MALPQPHPLLSTTALQRRQYEAVLTGPNKFDPKEIRLSEAGQCGRRQTLRALGYPATPPTLRDLAIFETGHLAEDRIAALWEAQCPGQLQREVEVRTAFGVGHIDLWIEPLHHLVECKTTTEKRLSALPLSSHVAQVTLYLHFFGHAQGATAEIAYLIKETGEIHTFPVVYDLAYARELIVGLMEVQAAISLLREPLPIPDTYQATQFPCAWYSPQGLRRCGFWEHCWGQQVTTLTEKKEVVAVVPPLAADVEEYVKLRGQQQLLESQIDLINVRRDALEAGFADILDERQATMLRAGSAAIRRSISRGRTTTDIKAAIADGVITDVMMQPYQKTSLPYARWTIRKASPKNRTTKGD